MEDKIKPLNVRNSMNYESHRKANLNQAESTGWPKFRAKDFRGNRSGLGFNGSISSAVS